MKTAADLYRRHATTLTLATAFLIPLKLSWCYVTMIPLIVAWCLSGKPAILEAVRTTARVSGPFIFFLFSLSASCLFGISPARSFGAIPAIIFFAVFIFAVRDVVSRQGPFGVLMALLLGQSLAAAHSVIAPHLDLPHFLSRPFLGEVTESGQLVLSLLAGAGGFLALRAFSLPPAAQPLRWVALLPQILLAAANVVLFSAFAFSPAYKGHILSPQVLAVPFIAALSVCVYRSRRALMLMQRSDTIPVTLERIAARRTDLVFFLNTVIFPLLAAALLVNLKRGPWLGVAVGGTVLFLMHWRRMVVPLMGLAIAAYLALPPVRDRIAQSSSDFLIAGGRAEMWHIGAELALRFPLGMGLSNSKFLHEYSPSVPREMTHFHNNILNITVEGGILSALLFMWWIIVLFRLGVAPPTAVHRFKALCHGIACAILGSQVAGLVEYNWGDSEVRFVFFVLVGILLGIALPVKCREGA